MRPTRAAEDVTDAKDASGGVATDATREHVHPTRRRSPPTFAIRGGAPRGEHSDEKGGGEGTARRDGRRKAEGRDARGARPG